MPLKGVPQGAYAVSTSFGDFWFLTLFVSVFVLACVVMSGPRGKEEEGRGGIEGSLGRRCVAQYAGREGEEEKKNEGRERL